MTKRKTFRYAVAAATAATLSLAGCNGGDEDPTAAPTPTSPGSPSASTSLPTSPSPSQSQSSSPTTTTSVRVPSAAKSKSDAGAVAFARFYVLEVDKAYVSLDPSAIRAYSTADCKNCQLAASSVDTAKQAGERQQRSSFTITGAQTQPFPGRTVVDVYADVADVPSVDASGKVTNPGEPGKDSFRVDLIWVDEWKVKAVGPR